MTWHDSAAGGPRHGAHPLPRAGSWRPVRVVAVVLTTAVVGAGTWLLGAGSDHPASRSGPSGTRSSPVDSATPLAVAPPPGSAGEKTGATGTSAGSARRPRPEAAGVH